MSALSTPDALAGLAGPQTAEVWAVLVERFGAEIWRLMASRMRDAHEAEDAYQEFWMALPQNAARFRPSGPDPERAARAWLMRIAYVTAACRRNRRGIPNGVTMHPLQHQDGATDDHQDQPVRPLPAQALVADQQPATSDEDVADRSRLIGRVHDAIGDLPEGYRRPLLLHVVGGLSYEELASDLRCTVNNARVKVHRGLKRLRDMLGADGTALPDRALTGMFVPLIPFTPMLPPAPTIAGLAVKGAATKKAVSTKILLGKSASAAQAPIALKVMLTAACLMVAAVVTLKATATDDRRTVVPAAPVVVTVPAITTTVAPLDGLPASSAAYGLRRLRSAYLGSAIRVRSGERQQDIGFTGAGALDLPALRSLCGDGDGFVVRWYDQSGNGVDLLQNEHTRQPRLVAGGAVLLINDRPAMHIAGAEQWLDASEVTTVGSITALLRSGRDGLYPEWKVVLASNTTYDRRYFRGEIDHTTFDAVGDDPSIFYVNGQRSNDSAPLDAGKVVTADLRSAIANESLRLGNDRVQTHLRGWDGFIAELVVFPQALTRTDRQALNRAGQAWLAGEATAAR